MLRLIRLPIDCPIAFALEGYNTTLFLVGMNERLVATLLTNKSTISALSGYLALATLCD